MYSLFPYKVKVIRFQGTDVSFRRKGISPTPPPFFTSNIEYRFLYWQLTFPHAFKDAASVSLVSRREVFALNAPL